MFVLAKFKYTAKIPAAEFNKDFVSTLIEHINADFANYVIIDVGLCITFYDFEKIGDSFFMNGDSNSFTPVEFRYIVFQPFRGEILQGTIASCSSEGIYINLQFFRDIFVPPEKMPQVSKFDENEQLWYWEFINEVEEGSDEQPEIAKFYMEPGKVVRFRVADFKYRSVEPGVSKDVRVYEITASMIESGLGCVDWWAATEAPEEANTEMET